MLQCVAVCCSVLQCVALFFYWFCSFFCQVRLQRVAVCCSVLQCVAVSGVVVLLVLFLLLSGESSVLQRVAACCSVLQHGAVCCSVLQCAAVCCSVLQGQEPLT